MSSENEVSKEKIVPLFLGKRQGRLFTKEFLDNLQKKYKEPHHAGLLDSLMLVDKLSFHDAIVEMASWKNMKPEYIEHKND